MFISSGTSARYSIDRQFLIPGKQFFNESYADSSLVLPVKHIKAEKARNKIVNTLFDEPLPEAEEKPRQEKEEVLEDDSW